MHFTGSSFCNLSWKKESGVSWKPEPPSSLNGGIPAKTHVLSHVFVRVMFWDKRGRVGGFGGGLKREGFLPVSKWKTLVSKSGQDGRNSVNRAPERALDLSPRNSGRIDSVYVAGFLSGCRMCVLICINIFFFSLSQEFPSWSVESISSPFWKLEKNKQHSQNVRCRSQTSLVIVANKKRCDVAGLQCSYISAHSETDVVFFFFRRVFHLG